MNYDYIWALFALVFIVLPILGSWAMHYDWRR